MSTEERLRGSCSCGRYNYIVHIPTDPVTRSQAYVHFGTGDLDREYLIARYVYVFSLTLRRRTLACLDALSVAEGASDVVPVCHGGPLS